MTVKMTCITVKMTCIAMLIAIATPAFAQKVTIDYAEGYNFDGLESFQYVDTPKSNHPSQLMDRRIAEMLTSRLVEGGLKQTTEKPSIYVTYHMAMDEKTVYNTTSFGYGGYGYGWGRYGYGVSVTPSRTTEHTYTQGTLVIDAYDGETKDMVWSGSGTVTLKDQPSKQTKQIEKIMDKLGKRWDRIHASLPPVPDED
jgi:hypothetical protein